MSVNEKMTAIANAIRSHTGINERLTLDGMASGVHTVYDVAFHEGNQDGYNAGYTLGYNKAVEKLCPPINETDLVVQCCPLESKPFIIERVRSLAGTTTVTVCGKNLYNAAVYPLDTTGYVRYATGAFSESPDSVYRFTKAPIPAQHLQGKVISIRNAPATTNGASTSAGIAFYDANDGYISGTNKAQVTVPGNAYFMRFTINNGYVAEAQIELGSIVTGYEQYEEKQIALGDPSDLPMEIETLKGVNTIFAYDVASGVDCYATEVSVTGITDPTAEINRLKEYVVALSSASV